MISLDSGAAILTRRGIDIHFSGGITQDGGVIGDVLKYDTTGSDRTIFSDIGQERYILTYPGIFTDMDYFVFFFNILLGCSLVRAAVLIFTGNDRYPCRRQDIFFNVGITDHGVSSKNDAGANYVLAMSQRTAKQKMNIGGNFGTNRPIISFAHINTDDTRAY